jgi:hypothetical protein
LCNGRFATRANRAFGSGRDFIGLSRDDVVITGPTNTNVNDFQAVLVR